MTYAYQTMSEQQSDEESTQETPTGHTIPVPTREQVLADFEKVAKAKPPAEPSQRESGPEE
jgi:hypothetical protein